MIIHQTILYLSKAFIFKNINMKKSDVHPMPQFFDRYIHLAEDDEIVSSLEKNLHVLENLNREQLEKLGDRVYAPDKWTIKDIFQHMIDNERIQTYRALRFSRNDKTVLPGYDENLLAQNTNIAQQSLKSILEEFKLVRQSSIVLYKSFNDEMLLRTGICNQIEISVLALGFMLSGHQIHHLNVIRERYLSLLS
jgi:hypothetical protein